MKYIAMMMALGFFTAGVHAENKHDKCRSVAELSEKIMQNRQKGVPMPDVMKVGNGAFDSLVIYAYEQPRYQSTRMQRQSAEDFYNDVFLRCVKENRGK